MTTEGAEECAATPAHSEATYHTPDTRRQACGLIHADSRVMEGDDMAALSDIIRVVAQLNMGVGITVQNVYHLQIRSAGGAADSVVLDDMGEYLEGIYTEIVDRIPDDVIFDEYSAQNVTADVDFGTASWPTLTDGNNGGEPYAPGVAGLLRVRTTTPGREGRKFWGPFTEGDATSGLWTTTTLNNLIDAGHAAYDPFNALSGVDYQPVIYDRNLDVARDPIEIVASNNPAYQRRRRLGRGI